MWGAWLGFVSWGWLYCMICIGIYLIGYLRRNGKEMDMVSKLVVLAMLVLVFHVWEEWVIPGGFHWAYNIQHGSEAAVADRYPMNKLTDMITNFGGELLGLIWLRTRKTFGDEGGVAVGLFSIFEFVIHVWITIRSVGAYGGIWYAPGLVTATVGFLPVGILLIRAVVRNHKGWKPWAKGLVILVALSLVFVQLPENCLKSTDNPYGWTDHGFYDRYVEA